MPNATGGMRPSAPQYGPKKKPSATPKPRTTKKATATPKKPKPTLGPLPKNPSLNDYLIRGIKPPVTGKRRRLPSDADVRF
jgi:hypothetical protein